MDGGPAAEVDVRVLRGHGKLRMADGSKNPRPRKYYDLPYVLQGLWKGNLPHMRKIFYRS